MNCFQNLKSGAGISLIRLPFRIAIFAGFSEHPKRRAPGPTCEATDALIPTTAVPPTVDGSAYGREVACGPCVRGSGLARDFFTSAGLVGAAMCSAC
jgi:hypothetical protein